MSVCYRASVVYGFVETLQMVDNRKVSCETSFKYCTSCKVGMATVSAYCNCGLEFTLRKSKVSEYISPADYYYALWVGQDPRSMDVIRFNKEDAYSFGEEWVLFNGGRDEGFTLVGKRITQSYLIQNSDYAKIPSKGIEKRFSDVRLLATMAGVPRVNLKQYFFGEVN